MVIASLCPFHWNRQAFRQSPVCASEKHRRTVNPPMPGRLSEVQSLIRCNVEFVMLDQTGVVALTIMSDGNTVFAIAVLLETITSASVEAHIDRVVLALRTTYAEQIGVVVGDIPGIAAGREQDFGAADDTALVCRFACVLRISEQCVQGEHSGFPFYPPL